MIEDDSDSHKKLIATIIIAIGIIVVVSSFVVYATETNDTAKPTTTEKTVLKKTQPMKDVTIKGKHAPLSVKKNSTHVSVYMSKCSCGLTHHYKRTGKAIYKNYCPYCKHWNVLKFHTGSYKRTYAPEGELSCTYCGSDWCITHGKEKSFKSKKYLKKW